MILIVQGHLPYVGSERKLLYEAWARSVPTIFVEPDAPPWSFGRLLSLKKYREKQVNWDGLSILSLPSLLPGNKFRGVAMLNRWISMRLLLRWLRMRTDQPLVVTCQYPWLLPTLRGLGADLTAYDVVDDYVTLPDGSRSRQLGRLHRRFAASSDLVWTTSARLEAQIRELGLEPHRSPQGVDWSRYASTKQEDVSPEIATVPRPRIGLVGRLNDRIDWELVQGVCMRHPDWNLVFVGPIYGDDENTTSTRRNLCTESRPANLVHLPAVPPEEIPRIMIGLDIGLIPYKPEGANLSINPLKVYQFLATGIPVVASPLPSLADLREQVRIASTLEDLCQEIQLTLSQPATSTETRTRKDSVRNFDWTVVAEKRLTDLRSELANSRSC